MITTIDKVYKPGSSWVSSVGKDVDHKPTAFGVARDKSDRRDRNCLYLYPRPGTPNQTSLCLS